MARNKYGGVNDMPVGWLANKENKRVYQGKRYTYYNCFVESIAEIGG